jgi:hypothetical protein
MKPRPAEARTEAARAGCHRPAIVIRGATATFSGVAVGERVVLVSDGRIKRSAPR